jgi:hypothetical protein
MAAHYKEEVTDLQVKNAGYPRTGYLALFMHEPAYLNLFTMVNKI